MSSTKRPPTEEAIQEWLVVTIAAYLKIDPATIDITEPFSSYGLDSRTAVGLSGDLGQWVGRPLPATLVWDFPTIEQVARHLVAGETSAAAPLGES